MVENTLSTNNMESKHAFLIMAHSDFELLQTLIHTLDDSRNDIYVHIDKKTKDFDPKNFLYSKSKLYFVENRIDIRWGHHSVIQAEMLLFETALKHGYYSYYHLLSGADMPIKSMDYIHKFFGTHRGKEFVGFSHEFHSQALRRVCKYHFFSQYARKTNPFVRIFFKAIRELLKTLIFYLKGYRNLDIEAKKGTNWVSITNDFCAFLVDSKPDILKRFKYTFCGDEFFVQTVLWNSNFRKNIFNSEDNNTGCMREIDWSRAVGSSPHTWTDSDTHHLLSSNKIFARKFSTSVDRKIIDKIALWVTEPEELNFSATFGDTDSGNLNIFAKHN